jgi:hypothetical protein
MADNLIPEETIEMRVFDIVNNINEEEIRSIIIGFAESSDEAIIDNFIKNYCSIFSSFIDRNTTSVGGNYTTQLVARACSGGEFRDLRSLYANFLLNLNFKENYLTVFNSAIVDNKEILDMLSPVWEEDTQNLTSEPLLKRYSDVKESRIMRRLSTFLERDEQIRAKNVSLNANIILTTKYIG